jgi:hypothetical protein
MTNNIDGKYIIRVEIDGEVLKVPLVVSSAERDLYGACSPLNPWFSSLTFERGVPLEVDYHGAEATLVGYVKQGTSVAFIPMKKDLSPPWYGRDFIHKGDHENSYVQQFPYVKKDAPIFLNLMYDAVDMVLFMNRCNTGHNSCYWTYDNEGIYVDRNFTPPLSKNLPEQMLRDWGTDPFVVRDTKNQWWK